MITTVTGTGQAVAPCPPGNPYVLGGGGQALGGGSLTASTPLPPVGGPEPPGGNGWIAQANGPVTAYAICAK